LRIKMRSFSGKNLSIDGPVLIDFLAIVNLGGGQNSTLENHFVCHLDGVSPARIANKLNVAIPSTTDDDFCHQSPLSMRSQADAISSLA
jgi:hypothetical protein